MIIELFDKDVVRSTFSFSFPKAKGTGGIVIVKTDWCGHCVRTIPELEKVSVITGKSYPIFKIDADKNQKLLKEMNVNGFPTIYFINKDGTLSTKYEKDRQAKKFLEEICLRARVCY